MKKKKDPLETQEVIERLAVKYASPMYGFITQVRSATGFVRNARTADALAMSLWPSRGLNLYGFEVKVSRADWMKELKTPEKAEEIARYCHYWYVVVGDKEIIKPGELPEKWGLIVPHGKGLKITKEAPFDNDVEPIDHILLAGVFRNIAERCTPNEVIQGKMDEQYESGKEWAKIDIDYLKEEVEDLKGAINTFEEASGVEIRKYGGRQNKDLGEAVRTVLDGKDKEVEKNIEELLERAKNIVKYLEGEDVSSYKR